MTAVTDVLAAPPVRRLEHALRALAVLFLVAALGYLAGPLLGPTRGFFATLPFVSNSVVKVSLLAACCLYAAGDLVRHRAVVAIVIWAHAVSLAAMLLVLLAGDTSRILDPGLGGPQPVGRILIGAMVLDGVLLALLLLLYRAAGAALPAPPPRQEGWPSPAEQWLRRLLRLLCGVFVLGALLYEAAAVFALAPDLVRELPFVTNSVVKVATLAMLCGYVARDLAGRQALVGPVIAVHLVSVLAQGIYLLTAGAERLDQVFALPGGPASMRTVLWGAILLDGVIAGLLFALYYAAWRARLGAGFFRPLEYRTLVALAEVMIEGPDEPITAAGAARNVDRALARLRTDRKGMFRIGLAVIHYWPLLVAYPPLPELSPTLRSTYIRRRFYREAGRRSGLLRQILQGFTRIGHQLSVLGFYSDPRVHEAIGYRTFEARAREAGLQLPPPCPSALQVEYPWGQAGEVRQADVCIIGSGAAGSILAYSLAERGREVLLLERGEFVDPARFTEDELGQVGTLYQRGMLQVAEDFRFNVLQGNCVGGSTVVNNAICFAPPEPVLAAWNAAGAGLDLPDLHVATEWVRSFLQVRSLGLLPEARHHPSARLIRPALEQQGAALGLGLPEPFDVNIRLGDESRGEPCCFGCGNCNSGCGLGRKLSMLDHTLPRAQADFPGRVTVLAECEAVRFRTRTGRPARVLELLARGSDGRPLRIRAERFVVAAGAIASSGLLLRSGLGGRRAVGRGLAFNMITPVFAEFAEPQDAWAGIQMGHFVRHTRDDYILETWFSPPVGLATAMAGWFGTHYQNMRRARHLVAYGVVVGTQARGRVRLGLNGDTAFRFRPPPSDLQRLGSGLEALATLLFEAGARRVLLNTWNHGTLASPADVARVRALAQDPDFITLASSHPQGGNAINQHSAIGVVDSRFRVHGYANLHLCDASVFPGSVQVNPQMTVMALARYAAGRIEQ